MQEAGFACGDLRGIHPRRLRAPHLNTRSNRAGTVAGSAIVSVAAPIVGGVTSNGYTEQQRENGSRWKSPPGVLTDPARADAPYVGKDGKAQGRLYPFCLPPECATENLLPDVREAALALFAELGNPWHAGVNGGPCSQLGRSQVRRGNARTAMGADPARIGRASGRVVDLADV